MRPGGAVRGAPDGGWGWAVVAASTGNVGLTYALGTQGYSVLHNHIMLSFESGAGAAGWVMSSYMMALHMSGIVGNILTKRFGYRLVAVTGSVLGAVFVALGAFSSQLWQLCLSSGVMAGLCLGQVLYVSLLTPQLYFDKNRALAGGLINLSFIFSLISGPITERLTQHFAWRGTMLLWGGILLNQAVLSCAYRPINLRNQVKETDTKLDLEPDMMPDNKKTSRVSIIKIRGVTLCDVSLFCDLAVVLCLTSIICMNTANLSALSQLVTRALSLGLSHHSAALLPTVFSIGGILGTSAAVILVKACRAPVLFIYISALITGGVLLTCMGWSNTFMSISVVIGLYGAALGMSYFCHLTCLRNITTPVDYGRALSFVLMSYGLTALVAIPFAGSLYDYTGSYISTYIMVGAVMLLGGVCAGIMMFVTSRRDKAKLVENNLIL